MAQREPKPNEYTSKRANRIFFRFTQQTLSYPSPRAVPSELAPMKRFHNPSWPKREKYDKICVHMFFHMPRLRRRRRRRQTTCSLLNPFQLLNESEGPFNLQKQAAESADSHRLTEALTRRYRPDSSDGSAAVDLCWSGLRK